MGRRNWRFAAVLAVVVASFALIPGRAAPSSALSGDAAQCAQSALSEAASTAGPQVGSLLAVRRVIPDGGTKPLLSDMAALCAVCSIALAGSMRRRPRPAASLAHALMRVPCGVRAPPVRSV
jgi:hypothetical protein